MASEKLVFKAWCNQHALDLKMLGYEWTDTEPEEIKNALLKLSPKTALKLNDDLKRALETGISERQFYLAYFESHLSKSTKELNQGTKPIEPTSLQLDFDGKAKPVFTKKNHGFVIPFKMAYSTSVMMASDGKKHLVLLYSVENGRIKHRILGEENLTDGIDFGNFMLQFHGDSALLSKLDDQDLAKGMSLAYLKTIDTIPVDDAFLAKLYEDMMAHVKGAVWLRDEYLYTMILAHATATYFIDIFSKFGMLHPNGLKRVAKSREMEMESLIALCGRIDTGSSMAALKRDLQSCYKTVFLDEIEKAKDKERNPDMVEFLNNVWDMNGEILNCDQADYNKIIRFHPYSAVILGNIAGLADTTADRVLPLPMEKFPNEPEYHARYDLWKPDLAACASIRDRLFHAFLAKAKDVHECYANEDFTIPVEVLDSRARQVLAPLYATCKILFPRALPALDDYARLMFEEKNDHESDDWKAQMLEILLVHARKAENIRFKDICMILDKSYEQDWIKDKKGTYKTKFLKRPLEQLGFKKNVNFKKRNDGMTVLAGEPETITKIEKTCKNNNVQLDDTTSSELQAEFNEIINGGPVFDVKPEDKKCIIKILKENDGVMNENDLYEAFKKYGLISRDNFMKILDAMEKTKQIHKKGETVMMK